MKLTIRVTKDDIWRASSQASGVQILESAMRRVGLTQVAVYRLFGDMDCDEGYCERLPKPCLDLMNDRYVAIEDGFECKVEVLDG